MIERVMLHEAIVKEIKKYIEDNQLKPGDRLPNQEQLTQMFGVSRTSLREALRTLQAMEIIEVKNGKGIYVKSKDSLKIEATINVEDERQLLLNILEMRRGIEGLAVKLAAERATQEDIEEMYKNLVIMKEKSSRGECNPVEDRAFHHAIYRASKNPILNKIVEDLYEVFGVLWNNPLGMGKAMNEGINLHEKIFIAIKNKEPKKAEKAFEKLMNEYELMFKSI